MAQVGLNIIRLPGMLMSGREAEIEGVLVGIA